MPYDLLLSYRQWNYGAINEECDWVPQYICSRIIVVSFFLLLLIIILFYTSPTYRQACNISRTLECNKIVDHSDVVGASPVGAAPTTSSFSTWYLALMDWAEQEDATIIYVLQFGTSYIIFLRKFWKLIRAIVKTSIIATRLFQRSNQFGPSDPDEHAMVPTWQSIL